MSRTEHPPLDSILLRVLLCAAGLGTIFPLLGYLYGFASMGLLAMVLLLPAIIIYLSVYLLARRRNVETLVLRFERGFFGGLMGIAGYDLVRVPMHLAGFNPFAAIQSYGVYITGASQSSLVTDVAGLLYHTSNGIFFGIMFTMIVGPSRVTPLLAIVWSLALEAFAVVTVFGEVYHLRKNTSAVSLAFFAHLFYGAPLAWAAMRNRFPPSRRILSFALAIVALVAVWILVRPPGGYESGENKVGFVMRDNGVQPRWLVVEAGTEFHLSNQTGDEIVIDWPFTSREPTTLEPGTALPVSLEEAGIYQVRARREDWRSVFVILEEDGFVSPGERRGDE